MTLDKPLKLSELPHNSPFNGGSCHKWLFIDFIHTLYICVHIYIYVYRKYTCIYICIFLEREEKGWRKRGRETLISFLTHNPNQRPGLQPRRASWLGIKPATFQFAGWRSTHWATPARSNHCILKGLFGPTKASPLLSNSSLSNEVMIRKDFPKKLPQFHSFNL